MLFIALPADLVALGDDVHIFHAGEAVELVGDALIALVIEVVGAAGHFKDQLHRVRRGVLHFQQRLFVEVLEDKALDGRFIAAPGADDEQYAVFIAHAAQKQQHEEKHAAAHACHQIIAHAAADAYDDGPENIGRIAGILDGRAETHDGQCAHHAQGQGDVVADDGHHRGREDGERHQRDVKLAAVGRAAVRVAIGKENGQAQQRRNGDVQYDFFHAQRAALLHDV